MEKLIRWGIWGTGAIAHSAADDLRLVRGTVLHGVASRRVERARSFAAQHGIARFYAGLQDLLANPRLALSMLLRPTTATSMTVCPVSRQARHCCAKSPSPSTWIRPSGLWTQPANAKSSVWKQCGPDSSPP